MSFDKAIARMNPNDLQFIVKNGKRSSVLLGYDFNSLIYSSYRIVKEVIPELINKGKFELLYVTMFKDRSINVFHSDINNAKYQDNLMFLCWLLEELSNIGKMESQYLSSMPDLKLIAAGINELNQFGELNIIDSLAGGDVLKWEAIKDLKYHIVFDKQYKSIIESRINKTYAEQNKPKNK